MQSLPKIPSLPRDFFWAAATAGIKTPGRLDVAAAASKKLCSAAAIFTTNCFAAAPVVLSRRTLETAGGKVGGVVVNAGCANAATGETGMQNATTMAKLAEKHFAADAWPFLVCSTGTIGTQLPMEKVQPAIQSLNTEPGDSFERFSLFSQAILTTDTRPKTAFASFSMGDKTCTIAGCAKGSGMIGVNMATLLAFVFTDAAISPALLRSMFCNVCDRTLNCLTIDGDTSTNDTAIVLANGASGLEVWEKSASAQQFEEKLHEVLVDLTRQLARDGEGASKLIEVTVRGAEGFAAARKAAFTIAESPLVKTAIYGRDANWGRIVCALGYSGVEFDARNVSVRLGDIVLFSNGAPVAFNEDRALEVLSQDTIEIEAWLGHGDGAATVYTCDLTEKYIEINGSYRT